MEKLHTPVLLSEVLAGLDPRPGKTYLDLTAGYGGHASEILDVSQQFKGSVLVDRDEFAADYLRQKFPRDIEIKNTDFYSAVLQLAECGKTFDMILADFGVSSPQLDMEERGFSFKHDRYLRRFFCYRHSIDDIPKSKLKARTTYFCENHTYIIIQNMVLRLLTDGYISCLIDTKFIFIKKMQKEEGFA